MYYRNAQAALVVYDLTKKSSLTKARHWVAELQRQASPGIVIGFVGNKADLCAENEGGDAAAEEEGDGEEGEAEQDGDARRVGTKEAKAYADEEGLLFFETSAKSGLNVNEVFTAIANAIPEASLKGPRAPTARGGAAEQAGGQSRVDLGAGAGQAGAKEGCAC